MNISKKETKGIPIVALSGRLDAVTAPELESVLEGAAGGHLVLCLDELQYISSAGLRVILAAAKRQRGSGGVLHIAGLQESVGKVFEISGFNTIFSIFDSEDEAIKAATP